MLKEIKYYSNSILNSYSIIFFSDKYFLSVLLILVSFIDIFAGLLGLIAVVTSITAANILGFDKYKIEKGFYGFNSLLVGLGVGLHYEMSWVVVFVMIFAAIFSLFITVSLEGILGKYFLPYLSLPFLISFWIISLATRELQFLAYSSRGLFFMDELVVLGGSRLLSIVQWWGGFEVFASLKYYFISMGAIFFQYNVISGILVAAGLLLFSRIAFSLSLLGFYIAFFIYQMIGTQITDIGYSYIGFNYILTSIALGGYFLVPSKSSYLSVIILTPLLVLLTIALSSIFSVWHLHIYSLTFNIVVLTFLYVLKQRVVKSHGLTEVIIQQETPESNLYNFLHNNHRFRDYSYFSIRLPFFGQWNVSQAHNGDITHKENWRHAWDFVIKDSIGLTHKTHGNKLTDYYCYGKAVLAPMDGSVEEVIDGIPDNDIGDVNVENNWGNTIIIKHGENFYSKLCHLKPGSFKVSKGDAVKAGQSVASCGSSGRSPEPHLHFQLQATPLIDGETMDYPIAHYTKKTDDVMEYKSFDRPVINDIISNVEVNNLMKDAFHFIPGQKIKFETEQKGKIKKVEWQVITDIYNYTYLFCKKTNSYAYFYNDERVFYFYKFSGSKKSLLYNFFLAAYKAPLGFYENLILKDSVAINLTYSYLELFLQDFIAPFFVFLKSDFILKHYKLDNVFNTAEITLHSSIRKSFLKYKTSQKDFEINIKKKGIHNFIIKYKNKKNISTCIE